MYNEAGLKFLHTSIANNVHASIGNYNMEKLEMEYDYETDEE